MKAEEIKDAGSLEAWLNARPEATRQSDAAVIAERATFRLVALALSAREQLTSTGADLQMLRLLLTSAVSDGRRLLPKETIERLDRLDGGAMVGRGNGARRALMVFDASCALISILGSPTRSVRESVRAVSIGISATSDRVMLGLATWRRLFPEREHSAPWPGNQNLLADAERDLWEEISRDCLELQSGKRSLELRLRPLWQNMTAPPWNDVFASIAQQKLGFDPETWSFWTRWWDGILSGRQIDWDLQHQVALIPDALWQEGPAAVAEAIREIELDFAIARTPNAEIIELNPVTGLFRSVPDTRLPADHLRDVTQKLADAADVFGGLEQTDNRYTAACPDIDFLRARLARDRNNPRALYDLSRSVAQRLSARVRDQSLPPEDPLIEDCIRQLEEAAIDIVGFDEKTREVVNNRAAVRLARLDPEAMPDVMNRSGLAARLVEGELVEDMPRDALLVIDPTASPEDRAAATYSTISRFSRMLAWYRALGTKEKVLAAGGGLVIAAGGANTLFEFFSNLAPFLQWLFAAIF